jgi:hypothetical protein
MPEAQTPLGPQTWRQKNPWTFAFLMFIIFIVVGGGLSVGLSVAGWQVYKMYFSDPTRTTPVVQAVSKTVTTSPAALSVDPIMTVSQAP